MKLIKLLGTLAAFAAVLSALVERPAVAQEVTTTGVNAAGSAAFSIGPDGSIYGAAVSAAVGENAAFAAAANTPEGSTAYSLGTSATFDSIPNFLPDISGTVFNFGKSDGGSDGFGIVSISITDGNVVVTTEPEEALQEAFDDGVAQGRADATEELVNATNAQLLAINNQLGAIDGQIPDNLQGQLTGLGAQLTSLANQLAGVDGQIPDDLQGQLTGLGGQLTDLANQLGGVDAQIPANLQTQLEDISTQLDNLAFFDVALPD